MSWESFDEFRELQRRLNQLFDKLWTTGWYRSLPGPHEEMVKLDSRRPTVDVIDAGDEIKVIAELPGLKKEDINVYSTSDGIEISAEIKEDTKKEEKGYIRKERRFEHFYRRIPLSAAIDADKVSASYKNGILELHLPKTEEIKGKRIKID
ncbi:MAG: Hsp20/alpha crystallin family protein [Promethearchaeota archaeon]